MIMDMISNYGAIPSAYFQQGVTFRFENPFSRETRNVSSVVLHPPPSDRAERSRENFSHGARKTFAELFTLAY